MLRSRLDRWILFAFVGAVAIVGLVFGWRAYQAKLRSDLTDAARRGDADRVQALLDRGVNPNPVGDTAASQARGREEPSDSPLEIALSNKHPNCAILLIKGGADITPYAKRRAAANQDTKLLDVLLSKGLSPREALTLGAENDNGAWVAYLAGGWPDLLKDQKSKDLLLVKAAGGRALTVVETLCRLGADPNSLDPSTGLSPLMEAASSGDVKMIRVLESLGANPAFKNSRGFDAYTIASRSQAGGNRPEVLALLGGGVRRNSPPNPSLMAASGFFQQGRYVEAEAAYRTAAKANPREPVALIGAGESLRMQNRLEEALPLYRKAVAVGPQNAEAHWRLGSALMSLSKEPGGLAEARTEIQAAIRLGPNDHYPHYLLGLLEEQAGNLEIALQEARKAASIQPNYSTVQTLTAWVLIRLGRYDQALLPCRRAIELNPDSNNYANYGRALAGVGKNPDAIEACDEALRQNATNVEARYYKAIALENLGKKDEAREQLRIFLQNELPGAEGRQLQVEARKRLAKL